MTWAPMSREEANAALAEYYPLTGATTVGKAAGRYEAQMVLDGRSPEDIYERLTDFLGRRPDEPPV